MASEHKASQADKEFQLISNTIERLRRTAKSRFKLLASYAESGDPQVIISERLKLSHSVLIIAIMSDGALRITEPERLIRVDQATIDAIDLRWEKLKDFREKLGNIFAWSNLKMSVYNGIDFDSVPGPDIDSDNIRMKIHRDICAIIPTNLQAIKDLLARAELKSFLPTLDERLVSFKEWIKEFREQVASPEIKKGKQTIKSTKEIFVDINIQKIEDNFGRYEEIATATLLHAHFVELAFRLYQLPLLPRSEQLKELAEVERKLNQLKASNAYKLAPRWSGLELVTAEGLIDPKFLLGDEGLQEKTSKAFTYSSSFLPVLQVEVSILARIRYVRRILEEELENMPVTSVDDSKSANRAIVDASDATPSMSTPAATTTASSAATTSSGQSATVASSAEVLGASMRAILKTDNGHNTSSVTENVPLSNPLSNTSSARVGRSN